MNPKPIAVPKPLLIKRTDLPRLLSMSLRKVDDLLASGELPRRVVKGGVFVTLDALKAFISVDHPLDESVAA